MGFRLNMGATMPCRIHDGYVEVDLPRRGRYKTAIGIETDWQCNTFYGENVRFVLYQDGLVYVGTKSGCINVFDLDGIMHDIYGWRSPSLILEIVGYYKQDGKLYRIYRNMGNDRVLMLSGCYKSFILNENVYFDPDLDALRIKEAKVHDNVVFITEGGEVLNEKTDGYWVEDDAQSRANAIKCTRV